MEDSANVLLSGQELAHDTKEANMEIVRYGYINSTSSAGKPSRVAVKPEQIIAARRWVNTYGNPSYCFRINGLITCPDRGLVLTPERGITLYCVDDFGGSNDLRVNVEVVKRRSDLFAGWVG